MLGLIRKASLANYSSRALAAPALQANSTIWTRALSTSAEAATVQTTEEAKPDNTLFPLAPIRKFFEANRPPDRRDGTANPIHVGRPWFASELRLKSFEDLHKLHFVLLIERNKLLNEKIRSRKVRIPFPSPERLKNVRRSMARLQTVLTERAIETRNERIQNLLDNPDAEKPVKREMTPAEDKWHRAHEHFRAPRKSVSPSRLKASGGQKTRRKIELAKEFEEQTLSYIAECENGTTEILERPRWRTLDEAARLVLREKQSTSRREKAVSAFLQSQKTKGLISSEETAPAVPKWEGRPELVKMMAPNQKRYDTGILSGTKKAIDLKLAKLRKAAAKTEKN